MTSWLPGWREWRFSIVTFAAAALALLIAFETGLEAALLGGRHGLHRHPATLGRLRAKALARFLGTLAGGAFAVAAVPMLVDAPPLLVLVLALWVAGCTMGSLYDPTPRSYAFRLAGFTAALIAFPSVDAPGAIFDTALAAGRGDRPRHPLRHAAWTRSSRGPPRPSCCARLEAWIGGMARFGADALSGRMEGAPSSPNAAASRATAPRSTPLFEQARYEAARPPRRPWLPGLRAQARRSAGARRAAAADRVAALRTTRTPRRGGARAAAAGGRGLAGAQRRPGAADAARAMAPALLARLQAEPSARRPRAAAGPACCGKGCWPGCGSWSRPGPGPGRGAPRRPPRRRRRGRPRRR